MDFCIIVNYTLFDPAGEHVEVGGEYGAVVDVDEFGELLPEHLGGLLQVVVRHLGKQVVHLVRADAVDDVVNDSVVAVDRAQLAADIVPQVVGVPRNVVVVVMEEGDHHGVGGEHEQRAHVVVAELGQSDGEGVLVQTRPPDDETRQGDQAPDHVVTEQRLERVEVRNVAGLVPSDEVPEPADAQTESWKDLPASVVLLSDRVEHFVLVDVARVFVVEVVRHLPRVVRRHQERVTHGPDDVA